MNCSDSDSRFTGQCFLHCALWEKCFLGNVWGFWLQYRKWPLEPNSNRTIMDRSGRVFCSSSQRQFSVPKYIIVPRYGENLSQQKSDFPRANLRHAQCTWNTPKNKKRRSVKGCFFSLFVFNSLGQLSKRASRRC